MTRLNARPLAIGVAVAALAGGGAAPLAFASHGADDPVTHDRGDDHGARHDCHHRHHRHHHHARHGRHGADDRPGHERHGADDGPNHQ
jgi:hypothetical protein